MKATYRPKVRNGQVTRRPVRSGHLGRAGWMPGSRRPQTIWALIVIGAVIAGGFITSLRWQMRALETGRKVVELKSALDQAESERKYLAAAESGSRNPLDLERAVNRDARSSRLGPAHLDEPSVLARARMKKAQRPAPNAGEQMAAGNASKQMAAVNSSVNAGVNAGRAKTERRRDTAARQEKEEGPARQERIEKPILSAPASTQ